MHARALLKSPRLDIQTKISYRQPINGTIHNTLAEIVIKDNGPGINEEIKDQIFFPMISGKENGSGIGLSISQDIVRIHGGTISFDRQGWPDNVFYIDPYFKQQY